MGIKLNSTNTFSGAGIDSHLQLELKKLSTEAMKYLKGELEEILGNFIDEIRDNIIANGSIYSEALIDSIEQKILFYPPSKNFPFCTIKAYVGVNTKEDKLFKGELHVPAIYAPIIEYGGTIKTKDGKEILIHPKPFIRPAASKFDLKGKIKKASKNIVNNIGA